MATNVTTDNIRNFCLMGKAGGGKTTIAESMLFAAGVTTRLGKIEEGNTVCDYREDEIERRMSINLAVTSFDYKGRKLNLMDTPGCADFFGDVASATTVSETVVFVIGADTPIDVSTEEMWEAAVESKKPVLIVVNKCEKPDVNLSDFFKEMDSRLDIKTSPLVVSGAEQGTAVNLLTLKKTTVAAGGKQAVESEAGALDEKAKADREKLVDSIASSDDALIEKYLGGETLGADELEKSFAKAFRDGKLYPAVCVSAASFSGVHALMDVIGEYCPPPAVAPGLNKDQFTGLVFKTLSEPGMGQMNFVKILSGKVAAGADVYNASRQKHERVGQICAVLGKSRSDAASMATGDIGVLVKLKETRTNDVLVDAKQSKADVPEVGHIKFPDSLLDMAVTSGSKGEEEKVGNALSMMSMEDPTLKFRFNPEIKEMVLSGVGVIQLEVVRARMKNRFGIHVELKPPKVPYKETVKGRGEGQGKFKRQTGGRGQYGDCWLKIGPLERGKGFEFVDDVFGGAIPKNFIPSIEKGVVGTMETGVISGHPVVDCKVTVYDGSYHEVDSSDMAFKLAGSLAFKTVFAKAKPIILEPIMNLEVTTPDDFVGAVMGDLNSRRGRVMGIDRFKKRQIVKAQVPLGEVQTYAPDLRSLTKGAGKYKISFSHYEELPANLAKNLMEAYQKTRAPEE